MMMSEALIRFGIFSTLLVVLILAEAGFERKARVRPRKPRWFTNISLTISNMIALFFLGLAIPMLAIGAAFDAANQGWGLFNILNFGGGCLQLRWCGRGGLASKLGPACNKASPTWGHGCAWLPCS